VGVRFHVVDVTGTLGSPQCKSDTRLTTNEKSVSYQDTISAVLGSRFLAGLCPIHIDLSSFIESGAQRVGRGVMTNDLSTNPAAWRIEGLVSKAPSCSNMGEKVAREVQFFSMNGRPVDLPKFSKVILDTWKIYDCLGNGIADDSIRKRPACILGLYLPSYMIDVNVSPDKREVFIVDDENLNTAIKEALSRLWSGQRDGVFKMNEASSTFNKKRSFEDSTTANSCDDGAGDPNSSIRVQEKNGERILLQQSKLQFRYSTTDSLHDEMIMLDPSSSGHKNGAPSSSDKQRPPERSVPAQVPTFVKGGDSNLQIFVNHPDNRDQVAVSSEIEDKMSTQQSKPDSCFGTGNYRNEKVFTRQA